MRLYSQVEVLLIICMFLHCNGHIIANNSNFPKPNECGITKPGKLLGEATMFQEKWVHGKTGACGFEKPVSTIAEGFFTAVGTEDWEDGLACGTCVELGFKGRTVVVNVVDRCGACTKGWFDMGGPAWKALTGELPGHVRQLSSKWVECPRTITNGQNMHIYVKPGSHAWDARFQPFLNEFPVQGMFVNSGAGWLAMKKCENFMFCKPSGIVMDKTSTLRISSVNKKNIDVRVEGMPEGQYIDTGTNNGGLQCSSIPTSPPSLTSAITQAFSTVPPPPPPVVSPSTTPAPPAVIPSNVNCANTSGLFPDPDNCRGFIKCAQGNRYPFSCEGGLYFDVVIYNCNSPYNTDCGTRPIVR